MDLGRRWVVAGALAAFGGSLFSGFHFDDYGMLQDRVVVSADGWLRCWSWWYTRPLTWFTFWMNYQTSGREAWPWHAVNLALHVACALVLYRLLQRLVPEAALLGALLFAVHPMQAEALDYVYARAIVLCTLFSLLAIDAWVRDRVWMAVGWFALALLSKEECVSVPLVLALYSFWRGQARKRFLPLAAMLGIAVLAGVRVIAAIRFTGMKNIGVNAGISPLGYLSEQGFAILRYLGLLLFPWYFSVDVEIPNLAWGWRVVTWAVLLAAIGFAVSQRRKVPPAGWFIVGLILLIPSSSIFPAADLAADRRMYLPMLAFATGMGLVLRARSWRWIAVCFFVAVSIGRTYVWGSDERLWSEAMERAPGKVRPMIQLSRAVAPERAVTLLQDAERMAPEDAEIPTELARVYMELNRPGDALAQAGRALALSPREPHALNNRGAVLLAMKQTAAARQDFVAALRVDACLEEARENLERSGGIPADAPRCER